MTFVEVVNEWTTKDQELWEQFCDGGGFRMWGYNISNTHPLKAPFLLYKEMMEEVENREEEEEEEERDDEGSGLFYVLVERRVPGHVMGCDAVNSTQCQHYSTPNPVPALRPASSDLP